MKCNIKHYTVRAVFFDALVSGDMLSIKQTVLLWKLFYRYASPSYASIFVICSFGKFSKFNGEIFI